MNEMPFPKPPPEGPLPLEKWLRRTDRAESGREPFFRGRNEEYGVFRSAAMSLNDGVVGGGTMVFQGAPGSGKSALMAECMEAVRCHSTPEDPWVAVSVDPDSLQYPVAVVRTLVEAANEESTRLRKMIPRWDMFSLRKMVTRRSAMKTVDELLDIGRKIYRGLSERGVGVATLSVGGRKEDEVVAASQVFRDAAPLLKRFRIVVFVDEAQNLQDEGMSRGVLDCLHRDPQGIPLVTAFFGLSDTKQALRECGLSRFPDGREVGLKALPLEDAASAVCGVFEAYGFTGTPEDLETWIERLADLSQGWPQHINSVSIAASTVIRDNGGRIVPEHLDEAITLAEQYKDEYYEGRLAAGSSDAWVYRELALAVKERVGFLARHEIGSLTQLVRKESGESIGDFLTNALHAGLLAPDPEKVDQYRTPIPSLGDYLRALEVRTPEEFRE